MKKIDFQFDKFIKDITQREQDHRDKVLENARTEDEDLAREFYRRYRDNPRNRTVYKR